MKYLQIAISISNGFKKWGTYFYAISALTYNIVIGRDLNVLQAKQDTDPSKKHMVIESDLEIQTNDCRSDQRNDA